MPVDIAAAQGAGDLCVTLRSIDISVPGRIDGRTTDDTETWTLARLLSTLAAHERLDFPLSVMHRDRPDSVFDSEGTRIGVEVTEAISQQYAAYFALAEREFPDVLLEPAHLRWGAPTLTLEEMRELLRKKQLSAQPWAGDRPEQEWALFIQSIVDTKLKKLARPDFEKFDENWLAIYDNLPLPHIDLAKAIGFLRPLLNDRWTCTSHFDVLFIEHGPVIARVTAQESEHLVLNDLWE